MHHHATLCEPRAMTTSANQLTLRATSSSADATPAPLQPPLQLRAFIDAFEQLGFDAHSLLAAAGLRRADLSDPDALIPCTALEQVFRAAAQQRCVPNLGAQLAAVTPIGAYPLLDYLILTTDNVEGALEQLVRYFHIVDSPIVLSLLDKQDIVYLQLAPGVEALFAQ